MSAFGDYSGGAMTRCVIDRVECGWRGSTRRRPATARAGGERGKTAQGVVIVLPALQALVPRLFEAFTNQL
jgi:hypothetical protein